MDTKTNLLEDFINKNMQILIFINAIDISVDIPDINYVI